MKRLVMKFENEILYLVKKRFPGRENQIENLYNNNEHFRELCDDYLICVKNLGIVIDDIAKQKGWMQEYEHLRKDLEAELTDFMNGSNIEVKVPRFNH